MPSLIEMKMVIITCAFALAIAASFFAIAYFSSLFSNGAYKAVVWFLVLILDANIASKYFRWVLLH